MEKIKNKSKKKKVDWYKIQAKIPEVIGIVVILLALAFVGVEIYVWVTYANTPASELPAWILFLMFGGKK